ncbi:MAG TPA: Hsp20/alpha crystallin family protein [Gemmatimonadales bacterium]|nr:Hsp20/alpha crystallin family protein [Gemmatimonadales bacterium]
MKLMKAPPTLAPFRTELDRVFDRFFKPTDWMRPYEFPDVKVFETVWAPSVDLSETEKEYVVRLEAPGVNKENMDVSLENNVLTLSGTREVRKEGEGEEYIWKEREEGKFVRSLRLPKAVVEGKVLATYEDGILVVRLPKAEPTIKSRIAIK